MQSQIFAAQEVEDSTDKGKLTSAMPKRRPNLSLTVKITLTGETRERGTSSHRALKWFLLNAQHVSNLILSYNSERTEGER